MIVINTRPVWKPAGQWRAKWRYSWKSSPSAGILESESWYTGASEFSLGERYPDEEWIDELSVPEVGVDPDVFSDEDEDDQDEGLFLKMIGKTDPQKAMKDVQEICDKYLSDVENELIWLMLQSRRPVEISRILHIAECEVVRFRRNCFRKIRTVYMYDYHYDKAAFLQEVLPMLRLNAKQTRIFLMFYEFYGLRQIAETIGTRPSNVHRSLQMMRRKMEDALPEHSPHRVYLGAFHDFRYLCLTRRHAEA